MGVMIDSHAHIGSSWLNTIKNPFSPERLMEIYTELGIQYACISTWDILNDIPRGNEEAYQLSKQESRWIPYVVCCPLQEEQSVEQIKKYVGDCGFKGIKMHPTVNGYRVDSLRIMEPVMKLAAEYHVPVMFHGEHDAFGSPYQFAALAEAFPEVDIIVAHLCHNLWIDAIEVCRAHKNIYLDTAEVSTHNFKLERAIRFCGADKIIFGTDSPCTDIQSHMAIIQNINTYYPGTLDQAGLDKIMGGNIARLLHLELK
ncbi:TatD family hydrolase [uncultured Oscillibacter sp.]|uniref:amidohydrolase family protein n=2 Tax=uncultured Oscillibacter sp. TaxID=876091 RepID=UPI00280645C7|nr:amidohydrolase family protein [uncultured Oscillibacter sp.]